MSPLVLCVVLCLALVNGEFFGCTLAPAITATVPTGGYGAVACYSGDFDGVNTMSCHWWYANLTSAPTAAHWHVGSASTTNGAVTFVFDTSSTPSAVAGTSYDKFVASDAAKYSPQPSVNFAQQITACASGTGCYFNLHTSLNGQGEIRCEGATLTADQAFVNVPLVQAPGSSVTTSSGSTSIWFAEVLPAVTPKQYAVAYGSSFSTATNVTNAHLHQGTSVTDNNGAVVIQMDWNGAAPRNSGSFVGVALSGTTTGKSNWPAVDLPGLGQAIDNHFCYVNIHTTGVGSGEIRANISPNSASHVTLAFLATVFMFASWMSL